MTCVMCDFLSALGVRHTDAYTTRRFLSMPFMSMFGMVNLLREYGVTASGYTLAAHKDEAGALPVPFVAPVSCGRWIVVEGIDSNAVHALDGGKHISLPRDRFADSWSGVALVADSVAPRASEPQYRAHRLTEIMTSVSRLATFVLAIVMAAMIIVLNRLWAKPEIIPLLLLNGIGLTLSILLMLKNNGVHTRAADSVCGILQRTGCSRVMDVGGTFLGIFHWSEVGVSYFSVSLAALMLFPVTLPWLAVVNVCCLPYTLWSVSYQHFKVHAWCTLCLGVQLTLWLLFGCYAFTGWWHASFSLSTGAALLVAYALTMLVLNHISTIIKRFADECDTTADSRPE